MTVVTVQGELVEVGDSGNGTNDFTISSGAGLSTIRGLTRDEARSLVKHLFTRVTLRIEVES
jgi:hypothetical protein